MKTQEIKIVAILFGFMLVMVLAGFSASNFLNDTLAASAQVNKINSTNVPNLQAGFQKGTASTILNSNNNVNSSATGNHITLGNPFYIESNKIISQVPVPLRDGGNATGIIFNGNGTIQGIAFKEIGRALIIPISPKIADITGGVLLKSNDSNSKNNGNATLSFREIGHLTASGVQGSGAAIFNPNASGNLSFLSNKVAIFTHNGNRNGTNMIKAWEWK